MAREKETELTIKATRREKGPHLPWVDACERATCVQIKARLSLTVWKQSGGNMEG